MSSEGTSRPVSGAAARSAVGDERPSTPSIWPPLVEVVRQARVALDSQLAAWKYGVAQILIIIGMSIPLGIAGCLLLIHGFLLLDSVLDYALARLDIAVWFSPLVRGGVYFGIPAIVGMIVLMGALPKAKKKVSANAKS